MKTDKFFNHFGRSDAWNSTHHGRYVFQTRFFREKYLYIYIYIYKYTYTYTYTYTYKYKYMYIYMCVYVCLCFFVVWCRWWWSGVWCGVNGAKVAEQIV